LDQISKDHRHIKYIIVPYFLKMFLFLLENKPNKVFTLSLRRPVIDFSKMDYVVTLKPTATFQLRPSLGSAFQPLSRTPGPEEGLDEAVGGTEPESEKE
jgi:hypothetical protein